MRLSIFNSSGARIAAAIGSCALMLAVYQGLVWIGVVRPSTGNNIYEDNQLRAEQYLYDRSPQPEIVLVGSSLMANLNAEYYDSSAQYAVENLGMQGGSTLTGLAIIDHCTHKPAVVVVEVDDTLLRGADRPFIDGLFRQPFYSIRKRVPMFRQEYQPVSALVFRLKHRVEDELKRRLHYGRSTASSNVKRKLLASNLAVQATIPTQAEQAKLSGNVAELRNDVQRMSAQHIRVILTEIPGEKVHDNAARQVAIRTLIHRLLPDANYEWLPAPPTREWQTTDGIHLTAEDARAFSRYLSNRINSPVSNGRPL